MDGREAKDRLYEAFARTAEAAANPKRIELLELMARRQGTKVFCRLAGADVAAFIVPVRDLARSRLAEVDQVVRVVILDVRPAEEFAAGHIPGGAVGAAGRAR